MKLLPAVLEDEFVRLEPLEERHRESFRDAARDDEATWPLLLRRWAGDDLDPEWDRFLAEQAAGRMICFIVHVARRCGGITCYLDPDATHATVEIGATWYHPSLRGGSTNPAAKQLLLRHAFEAGARRVQLKVDAANARSRAAVTKLGATLEGVLRQDRVTWTGRVRDTAFYSILRDEWPGVRDRLNHRLGTFRQADRPDRA